MDEFIDPASPLRSEPSSGIPAQMASIDLNLQAQEPVTDNIFAQSRPSEQTPMSGLSESTQVNKLNLASELMNAGDIDLARSLITSVASKAQGDIKVRALQMLGQIK
jgi:FimV-like protein